MHRWSDYSLTSENIGIYEEIFENLKIIDCHTHIGIDKDGHKQTADQLVKSMDGSNINKAIVFPLNDPRDNKSFHRPNDEVLLACELYKDRLIPFFRLNPNNPWKEEFNLRLSQGFRGIKLHPRSQDFKLLSSKIMEVYDAAQNNNLVILMHTGFGLEEIADDLLKIVRQFPKLKMIIGHAGFVDLDNVIKKISRIDNLILDTSTVKIFDLFDLFKKVDVAKLAFGSDSPYYDIDLALEGLIDSAITVGMSSGKIKKLLGGNMEKWFPSLGI